MAAPREAEAEQGERVQERVDRGLGRRLEHKAKQPAGSGVVPRPQIMATRPGEGGVDHLADFRLFPKPFRYFQAAPAVTLEADWQGAQPPQHQIGVLGRDRPADLVHRRVEQLQHRLVARRGRAHEHVRVAPDIFGQGLATDVDAMGDGLEQEPRPPGVVHHCEHAALACARGDRRDVLHFEAERPRRFQDDGPGLVRHHGHQFGRSQGLGVVDRGDAEPFQHLVAEFSGWPIDVPADQDFLAGLQQGQQGSGHGRQA